MSSCEVLNSYESNENFERKIISEELFIDGIRKNILTICYNIALYPEDPTVIVLLCSSTNDSDERIISTERVVYCSNDNVNDNETLERVTSMAESLIDAKKIIAKFREINLKSKKVIKLDELSEVNEYAMLVLSSSN